jgi:chitosanase
MSGDKRLVSATAIGMIALSVLAGVLLRGGEGVTAQAATSRYAAFSARSNDGAQTDRTDIASSDDPRAGTDDAADPTTSTSSSTATSSPATVASTTSTTKAPAVVTTGDLSDPARKLRAAEITSSFENDTTTLQYSYAENLHDGRGITAGRAGFCSGTDDLLEFVTEYTSRSPGNGLAKYLPALKAVNGTDSVSGLSGFEAAFAAEDSSSRRGVFRKTQDDIVDELYFNPAMDLARQYNVTTALGQAIVWDTSVHQGIHGSDGAQVVASETARRMGGAVKGNESAWLAAFLDVRLQHLLNYTEGGASMDDDSSRDRVNALRSILQTGNMGLNPPISWTVYGDSFKLTS